VNLEQKISRQDEENMDTFINERNKIPNSLMFTHVLMTSETSRDLFTSKTLHSRQHGLLKDFGDFPKGELDTDGTSCPVWHNGPAWMDHVPFDSYRTRQPEFTVLQHPCQNSSVMPPWGASRKHTPASGQLDELADKTSTSSTPPT
jgi:hypothetical protein